jgi:hypothetical protein
VELRDPDGTHNRAPGVTQSAVSSGAAEVAGAEQPTLAGILDLEGIDRDLLRFLRVYPDPHALYGDQVAAQALPAADRTVADGRVPHLYCYVLRRGDAARSTILRADRDGRSFSARKVVAAQACEAIAGISCSSTVRAAGPDDQITTEPLAGQSEMQPIFPLPRVHSMQGRLPEQPYPTAEEPVRLWIRATEKLPDDVPRARLHAHLHVRRQHGPRGVPGNGPADEHQHRARRLVSDDWVLTWTAGGLADPGDAVPTAGAHRG